jgi:hypothetical protein
MFANPKGRSFKTADFQTEKEFNMLFSIAYYIIIFATLRGGFDVRGLAITEIQQISRELPCERRRIFLMCLKGIVS